MARNHILVIVSVEFPEKLFLLPFKFGHHWIRFRSQCLFLHFRIFVILLPAFKFIPDYLVTVNLVVSLYPVFLPLRHIVNMIKGAHFRRRLRRWHQQTFPSQFLLGLFHCRNLLFKLPVRGYHFCLAPPNLRHLHLVSDQFDCLLNWKPDNQHDGDDVASVLDSAVF